MPLPSRSSARPSAGQSEPTDLERDRAKPGPDDPAWVQRQGPERQVAHRSPAPHAMSGAKRPARRRKRGKLSKQTAPEVARKSEEAAREAIAALEATREMTVQAARKAARDARYAARKAQRK
jgi:hypothetical protein